MREDIFDKIMHLPLLRAAEPFYKKNKEILLYVLFGGLTFAVSIFTFWLFYSVLGLSELVANVISWIITVTFAYITNRKWVFESPVHTLLGFLKETAGFFSGRLFTLAVEEIILYVFITRLGVNGLLVKIAAQIVVIVLNYVISKLIVFKKKK